MAERLFFSRAYLTWTREANELQTSERDLRDARIPYEEREVLFREKLLVERALLNARFAPAQAARARNGMEKAGTPTPRGGEATTLLRGRYRRHAAIGKASLIAATGLALAMRKASMFRKVWVEVPSRLTRRHT